MNSMVLSASLREAADAKRANAEKATNELQQHATDCLNSLTANATSSQNAMVAAVQETASTVTTELTAKTSELTEQQAEALKRCNQTLTAAETRDASATAKEKAAAAAMRKAKRWTVAGVTTITLGLALTTWTLWPHASTAATAKTIASMRSAGTTPSETSDEQTTLRLENKSLTQQLDAMKTHSLDAEEWATWQAILPLTEAQPDNTVWLNTKGLPQRATSFQVATLPQKTN